MVGVPPAMCHAEHSASRPGKGGICQIGETEAGLPLGDWQLRDLGLFWSSPEASHSALCPVLLNLSNVWPT